MVVAQVKSLLSNMGQINKASLKPGFEAAGYVDDALRNTVPSVNEPLLQLINAVFRFLCNVR